jgi:hypothetical protein
MTKRVAAIDPGTYQRHAIHADPARVWAETNCYVDVLIELVHALGHEPVAALPFTVAIDFEGDQWTFFKFPLLDLYELFGLDVQELALWRPLVMHIEEQVGRGRPVLVELDSFYLPDTAGTAYRTQHQKTTVAVMEIDVERQRLGYFHGQGYYQLDGADFVQALRLEEPPGSAMLPPYAEFVKLRRTPAGDDRAIVTASLELLRKHLRMVPEQNPFLAFRCRFEQDLTGLMVEGLETFHQYSFATLRQYGACYELSTTYLEWLTQRGEHGLEDATHAFRSLSEGAKTFQFQLARAMARGKPLDLSSLDVMAGQWERGIAALKARYC